MTNPPAEPWTTLSLLNWTKEHFERHEVDSPRLSAEILLAHSLRCLRIDLYTRFDYRPTPEELADFRRNVRRASRQEPVAYLVGEKEFYSLRFKVTPDVLVPRPETELLAQAAIGHLQGLGRPGALRRPGDLQLQRRAARVRGMCGDQPQGPVDVVFVQVDSHQ